MLGEKTLLLEYALGHKYRGSAPLSFARRVPSELLASFRYDSGKDGRALKFLEDGKLKRYYHYTDTVRFQEALSS